MTHSIYEFSKATIRRDEILKADIVELSSYSGHLSISATVTDFEISKSRTTDTAKFFVTQRLCEQIEKDSDVSFEKIEEYVSSLIKGLF